GDPNIVIRGGASFELKGQKVGVSLGNNGIVINKDTGALVSLDAAISTDITVGGLHIQAEDLGVHYAVADPNVTIFGSAAFELMGQKVFVSLGSMGQGGIVINKDTGQLVSLNASVTADVHL